MKKLLLKLFVKNYEDKENPVVRAKYGVLAGVFGIIGNIFSPNSPSSILPLHKGHFCTLVFIKTLHL